MLYLEPECNKSTVDKGTNCSNLQHELHEQILKNKMHKSYTHNKKYKQEMFQKHKCPPQGRWQMGGDRRPNNFDKNK